MLYLLNPKQFICVLNQTCITTVTSLLVSLCAFDIHGIFVVSPNCYNKDTFPSFGVKLVYI